MAFIGCVSAQDNLTADNIQASESDILTASNTINVHVSDSYDESTDTWTEDGVNLANASVNIYDESANLICSGLTDSGGNFNAGNLNQNKYNVEISYSTYDVYRQTVDLTVKSSQLIDYTFVPDILLIVYYNGHSSKVDLLMNMSRRVAYINTMDWDKNREWLFEYANFIHIDMFAEGSYASLTAESLKSLLEYSPANENYKVAYTFGMYNDALLNATNMHIVGANPNNNTFHTVENTYIGAYFQAEELEESEVLQSNMKNYLAYVYYLINSSEYTNPTLDIKNAPLLPPECGFYHSYLGMYTVIPEGDLINQWILANPGYSVKNQGSLNFMLEEYVQWLEKELDPTNLYKSFEKDLITKVGADKPLIIISTYYCGGDVVDSLIKAYANEERVAINVFKTGIIPSMASILEKISEISTLGISAINSLYDWSLNLANGSAEDSLENINVPVLKGVVDISQYSWESELGPQIEWTYMVTYPSFEGVYSPIILSYDDNLGNVHVIDSGIDKFVQLTLKWVDLKEFDNSDKIVSIVLYNYPPGKAEIGASYLDVFKSTYDLLYVLSEAGYDVGDISNIPTLEELTEIIVDFGNKGNWVQGLINEYVEKNWDMLVKHHQLISLDEFYELTSDMNEDLYASMISYWGDGLGEIMVYNDSYIIIPGIWFGNVFITFQPSRGWENVKNYHDLTLPPHQQYVTFYEWLDKTVDCNVIINMGTHGTLEWLPGKNIGVMEGDWAFELNSIPTIYPYIVSNPGEAMVARDRIAALMITHMTPAMVSSELYGNYTILLEYITHYKDQIKLNVTSNAEEYKKLILELAPALGFDNITDGESFDEWIDNLHLYLDEMQDDFYTYGLHSIGKILTGYELIEEVATIVSSQTNIYDHILQKLFPELSSLSYWDDIRGNIAYMEYNAVIKQYLIDYIAMVVNGTNIEDLNKQLSISNDSLLYNDTLYIGEVIVNIESNNEWKALLAALNGEYLLAGLFADPSYGDSIPTGYDGYASDSTRMPSKSAYNSAIKIVDTLLLEYFEEHGQWPELTALVLWGTEISRTEGIGIAEYLYFLGCRPKWAENGRVIGVELLDFNEFTIKLSNGSVISRPRIDVYASIVTSNKDWIRWMLTATSLAANATGEDETNNYVIKHYTENPTLDRLFGLPGNILEGTGMSTIIPNTASWDIDTVNELLKEVYLNKVSYSWNLDEKGNIVVTQQRDTYEYLLSNTNLITHNFDSTWRLFDSDDYYDWDFGLWNAAKLISQERGTNNILDTKYVDIRNMNSLTTRSFMDEFNFEAVSVISNPNYYSPLLQTTSGYNQLSKLFENSYAALILSGEQLNSAVGNQMTNTALAMANNANSVSTAAAAQSSMAWMLYYYMDGKWDANPEMVTQLADRMIEMALEYGFACCHHTCANLNFVDNLIQLSSLSPDKKQKYAEMFAAATLTDPLYTADDNSQGSDDSNTAAETLVNGTQEDSAKSSDAGGETAVGNMPSTSSAADAKSATSQSQDSSTQSSDTSSDDAGSQSQSYEISKKSASKSASAESSMPVLVIVAVICLVAIFFIGYVRNNEGDDDY